jgi:ATP-binding cassette subfamily F protein 3
VDVDYFAQDQYKSLDPNARILDDLSQLGAGRNQTELRTLLGCFLFSDDDVFKQIGVLSGGERNRYALARLLLYPSNFLLLDEPTNHLDMRAKDVLLSALRDYSGSLVFVSHDRYFIENLATRIFEVRDGQLLDYPGTFAEFLEFKNRLASDAAQQAAEQATLAASRAGLGPNRPGQSAHDALAVGDAAARKGRRLNPIKLQQLKDRRDALERETAQLEHDLAATETALAQFVNAEETLRQTRHADSLRARLEQATQEWAEVSEIIEEEEQAA